MSKKTKAAKSDALNLGPIKARRKALEEETVRFMSGGGPDGSLSGVIDATKNDVPALIAEVERLRAAGYRRHPEPREVTTVEELDALPVGSVVKSHYDEDNEVDHDGGVWEKAPGPAKWWPTGHRRIEVDSTIVCLPASTLFTPKVTK